MAKLFFLPISVDSSFYLCNLPTHILNVNLCKLCIIRVYTKIVYSSCHSRYYSILLTAKCEYVCVCVSFHICINK